MVRDLRSKLEDLVIQEPEEKVKVARVVNKRSEREV